MSNKSFLLIAASLLASGQDRQPGQGVNFFTPEREAAVGRHMAADFRRTHVMADSPLVMEYLRRLAKELAAHVPGGIPSLSTELTIDVDARTARLHEPIFFPGGYVIVRASLFLAAQNEAEFAAMLAHSIAHVAERHATRQATRGQIANLASVPLIFVNYDHASAMVPMAFLKFARLHELEADKLAVNLASAAGYDPAALIRYIERMQIDNPERQRFSPLPPVEERLAALDESVGALAQRPHREPSLSFIAAREEARQLLERRGIAATTRPTLRREGEDERPLLRRAP
jgi:predicted Zn-dependent protease